MPSPWRAAKDVYKRQLYGVPGNESHFQVSTIGDLTDADVEGLCRAFDRVLAPIVQTRAATEAARVHGGAS